MPRKCGKFLFSTQEKNKIRVRTTRSAEFGMFCNAPTLKEVSSCQSNSVQAIIRNEYWDRRFSVVFDG